MKRLKEEKLDDGKCRQADKQNHKAKKPRNRASNLMKTISNLVKMDVEEIFSFSQNESEKHFEV